MKPPKRLFLTRAWVFRGVAAFVLLGLVASGVILWKNVSAVFPGSKNLSPGATSSLNVSVEQSLSPTLAQTESFPTANWKPTVSVEGGEPEGEFDWGVAYVSIYEGRAAHIYAYPLPQGPLIRLTNGDWEDITPALHPNGHHLAFASNRRGYWDLYLLDLESGVVTALTSTPEYEAYPSWSPDGLWLAYESYVVDEAGGNLEIFIRAADGSQAPLRLTRDPAADHSPAWSPQGRQIAFVSTRSGEAEVWIADLDPTTQRFRNVSRNSLAADAHPQWSPTGERLLWSAAERNGWHLLKIWDVTRPEVRPKEAMVGDWAAWHPGGEALLVALQEPNQTYLVGYALEREQLLLPPLPLEGEIAGLAWGRATVTPAKLAQWMPPQESPTPLWTAQVGALGVEGRVKTVPLKEVQPVALALHDEVDEAFYALRQAVSERSGWDFLGTLEGAFVPLTTPLNMGLDEDWSYTGRAFRFHTAPLSAGWVAVVREDFGSQTYWRVYVRTRSQDGSQGTPLKALPWDFLARHSGDPLAYEQGGKQMERTAPGYWLDFTRLALAYGWERLPSLPSWRTSFSTIRYNQFVLRQGRDWLSAMLEIYPKEALDTPTPVSSPTPTPTFTPTPTKTATFTPTPYRSPTPTSLVVTPTPSPVE